MEEWVFGTSIGDLKGLSYRGLCNLGMSTGPKGPKVPIVGSFKA